MTLSFDPFPAMKERFSWAGPKKYTSLPFLEKFQGFLSYAVSGWKNQKHKISSVTINKSALSGL